MGGGTITDSRKNRHDSTVGMTRMQQQHAARTFDGHCGNCYLADRPKWRKTTRRSCLWRQYSFCVVRRRLGTAKIEKQTPAVMDSMEQATVLTHNVRNAIVISACWRPGTGSQETPADDGPGGRGTCPRPPGGCRDVHIPIFA